METFRTLVTATVVRAYRTPQGPRCPSQAFHDPLPLDQQVMAWMASRYLVESIMRDSNRRSLEKDL
jgi:hypothetical protein